MDSAARVVCVAALPDGVHFVVGNRRICVAEVRLYHVDGTLVHAFKGHTLRDGRCSRWR